MLSLLSEPPREFKQFRASPFRLQKTFQTPLKSLPRFIAAVLTTLPCDSGTLGTDQIVFEPKNTYALLKTHSIQIKNPRFILAANDSESVAALLIAILGDWVDFLFVPTNAAFAIYADHDEYITFYSKDSEKLASLASSLSLAGFREISHYKRLAGGNAGWR